MATTMDSAKGGSMLHTIQQRWRQVINTPADLSHINVTRWALIGLCTGTGASIALLSGKAFDALQAPPEQTAQVAAISAEPLALERLRSSELFTITTPKVAIAQAAPAAARASIWQLQGVFTGPDKTSGSAILTDKKQPARLLRTQQKLTDGATLLEVHNDRVVLQQADGRLQTVRFPAPSSAPLTQRVAAHTTRKASAVSALSNTQQRSQSTADSAEQRRALVRKRLETLRQRADQST